MVSRTGGYSAEVVSDLPSKMRSAMDFVPQDSGIPAFHAALNNAMRFAERDSSITLAALSLLYGASFDAGRLDFCSEGITATTRLWHREAMLSPYLMARSGLRWGHLFRAI